MPKLLLHVIMIAACFTMTLNIAMAQNTASAQQSKVSINDLNKAINTKNLDLKYIQNLVHNLVLQDENNIPLIQEILVNASPEIKNIADLVLTETSSITNNLNTSPTAMANTNNGNFMYHSSNSGGGASGATDDIKQELERIREELRDAQKQIKELQKELDEQNNNVSPN